MKLKDEVIEVAKAIYASLGAGYDEGVYHSASEVKMRLRGINYESEKPVQVVYKDHYVGVLFADIYVWRGDEKVLIEFKATGTFLPKAQKHPEKLKEIAQVDHYFHQLDLPKETPVLLINFAFPATSKPDIFEVH
ncbi:MAG: GxxExxY protein [bacterium]